MPTDPQPPLSEADRIRHDLQARALRIAELCQEETEADELYPQLLQQWVTSIGAVAGAIWQARGETVQLACEFGLEPQTLTAEGEAETAHRQLLTQVVLSGQPQLVPPFAQSSGEPAAANPTQYVLLLVPIAGDSEPELVVEIFHRSDVPEAGQSGAISYIEKTNRFVRHWLRNRALQATASQANLLGEVGEFSRQLHQHGQVRKLAYQATNDAARLLQVDRVSLCQPRGSGWRVAAVSGQDDVNRRANAIVRLQALVKAVLKTGEPFWYDGESSQIAPQLREPLEAYVDEGLSKRIGILPLTRRTKLPVSNDDPTDASQPSDRDELVGGLVIEDFDCEQPLPTLQREVNLLVPHVASALTQAVDQDRIPGMPVWRTLGKWRWLLTRKTLPKVLLVLTLLVAAAIALVAVPAPFELHAPGEIQPQTRRGLYPETNGFVYEVNVEHGQRVEQGQTLVSLRNTDLSVELQRTLGERDAVVQRLAAVQRARLDRRGGLTRDEVNQLAGEANRLKKQRASLDSQLEKLKARHDRLQVLSPIDGIVVSWDVENRLRDLPVTPQDMLLEVADPKQAWQIELHMQEDDVGYVLDADADSVESLQVTYFLNSHPEKLFTGTVRQIDTQASLHDEHGHTVKILVEVDEEDIADVKPGTGVSAKVAAGTRGVGFVWLHDVWEFVHRKIVFLF